MCSSNCLRTYTHRWINPGAQVSEPERAGSGSVIASFVHEIFRHLPCRHSFSLCFSETRVSAEMCMRATVKLMSHDVLSLRVKKKDARPLAKLI